MKNGLSLKIGGCGVFYIAVLILFFCFFVSGIFKAGNVSAAVLSQEKTFVKPSVIVSATIGIPKMSLWGYSSPTSVLELSGVGVEQKTISDQEGFYSFDLIYLPDTDSFPELCVTVIDKQGRSTPPTCVPKISAGNYFYKVGPVILPPTISLDSSQIYPGGQASAQGQTIPGSNVLVVLSRPEFKSGILGFSFVKKVLAFYLPSYNVAADINGNFNFNMPSNDGSTWRVFTIAEFRDEGKSPKSNTLKFENLTQTAYIWQEIKKIIQSLLTWPGIIILETLIIIILAIIFSVVTRKKQKRSKLEGFSQTKHKTSNMIEEYQKFLKGRKVN